MVSLLLVDGIGDWLVDSALSDRSIVETFEILCTRLNSIGIPISRGRLTWPTLHPLFRAETVLWRDGQRVEFQQFEHQDSRSSAWLNSPIKWMLDHDVTLVRRRLTGTEPLFDFPLLKDLAAEGQTDFLALTTPLRGGPRTLAGGQTNFGIYITWTTTRASGFGDADIGALQRLQRFFAVACRTALQPRMLNNIAETYLGPTVSRAVLDGHIQLGSGSRTRALVWYSDLRNSTHYSETLDEAGYLELLNAYFGCVAHAALEAGGEVLAFIGDAVLAIFPIKSEASADDVAVISRAATSAAVASLAAAAIVNETRTTAGLDAIRFGIAMNIGEVMFGNIGIARRLSFSVIGPTVNEVARIEKMTKALKAPVLATGAIAGSAPDLWQTTGAHTMAGVTEPMELFALKAALSR